MIKDTAEDLENQARNAFEAGYPKLAERLRNRAKVLRGGRAYAGAAPLHGACGMKHHAVDECDPTARGARRCLFGDCKKRFGTKRTYEAHLRNQHGMLAADLKQAYAKE